jgi:hypothetical protein
MNKYPIVFIIYFLFFSLGMLSLTVFNTISNVGLH